MEEIISIETEALAKSKGCNLERCHCGGFPDCICRDKRITQTVLNKWLHDAHRLRVIIFPHKYSETTKVAWDYYVVNVDTLERYNYVADVDPNAYFRVLDSFEAAMESGLKSALTIGKADGFEKFE